MQGPFKPVIPSVLLLPPCNCRKSADRVPFGNGRTQIYCQTVENDYTAFVQGNAERREHFCHTCTRLNLHSRYITLSAVRKTILVCGDQLNKDFHGVILA
jgi:hypothetical protein